MTQSLSIKITTITLAGALILSVMQPITSANAGHRYRRSGHVGTGEVLAAGAIGLALGAIIAGSSRNRPPAFSSNVYHDAPIHVRREYITTRRDSRDFFFNDRFPPTINIYPRRQRRIYYQPIIINPQEPVRFYRRNHRSYRNYEPGIIRTNPQTSAPEPWTTAWLSYCGRKFRSFNPKSGTYPGYDGRRHFCIAK